MMMAYLNVRVAYSETSIQTVYHYKNVFKRYRIVQCQVLVIGGDIGQSSIALGV